MIGQTISHYRILQKLGEGGMGVVYKAQDLTLNRLIALKFLPHHLTAGEADQARFLQEAQATSSLNHQNVCVIYELGKEKDQQFIAMEYVDGVTLRNKFEGVSLKISDVLTYAIQIGEALQEAHSKGIVHRDIKADNIMVNSKNQIKVMDFGLAKLKGSLKLTRASSTIGTLAYMAPEQIQGGEADARSDIFSFGVVFYEMLTGHLPFHGEHEAAIVYSIANEEPEPITKYRSDVSPELLHILNRSLDKDPEDRYQSVHEMVIDLRRLKKESTKLTRTYPVQRDSSRLGERSEVTPSVVQGAEVSEQAPVPLKSKKRLLIGLGAILVVAVAVVLYKILGVQQPETKTVAPIQVTFTQLTDQPGVEAFPDFSPDGNFIVYSKSVSGNSDIFLQRVGGGNPINLTKDSKEDNYQPSFSPDGQLIAFRSQRDGGGIFVMGATGESVRRLTDFGYNPVWSPDGQVILCATEGISQPLGRSSTSQLWVVNVKTGEKRLLSKGDAVQAHWSPHGSRVAYWGLPKGSGQRDIWTIPAGGGEPVPVTSDVYVDWNPVWSPDGKYIYFSSDRGGSMNLWRVPIEEESGKVLGEPEPITTPARWSGPLKISRDGHRVVYVALDQRSNIHKIAFDPSKEAVVGLTAPVTQGTKQLIDLDLSPDGQRIVFRTAAQQEDLFLIQTDGTGLRQLTDDIHKDRGPSWSPDGKRIAFYTNRGGRYEIWSINADGSVLQQLTKTSGGNPWYPHWFPDGMRIAYVNNVGTYLIDLSRPIDERIPQALPSLSSGEGYFYMTSLAPNGQMIAGHRVRPDGTIIPGVLLYSLQTQMYQAIADSGDYPVWLSDSRRLLFSKRQNLYIVDSQTKKFHEILAPTPNTEIRNHKISRDDRTIYFISFTAEADIWQVTMK